MENSALKLLQIAVRVYGAIVVLIFGSYFISLFIHDDVMLFKTPRHFAWVVGEIIVLLMILWGLFFTLSGFGKGKVVSLFCMFLAFVLSILVGWNNWRTGHPLWLGVLITLFLFLLPSVTSVILSGAKRSLPG